MAEKSIGVKFPFEESDKGFFLQMNKTSAEQIKSNLIHLLLTRKGERLYNTEFGTDLLRFIFEPNDNDTYEDIKSDIQNSVSKFIPNLTINNIIVEMDEPNDKNNESLIQTITDKQGSLITKTTIIGKLNPATGEGDPGHSISVKIDYKITEGVFESKDFIVLKF